MIPRLLIPDLQKKAQPSAAEENALPAKSALRLMKSLNGCPLLSLSGMEVIARMPLVVIKRDGSRQSFDKIKLINGMVRACEKRPVTLSQLEAIADSIEQDLQSGVEREISSSDIGEMVMVRLKDVDEVAYVRFASVYRSFKDINSFMDELKRLMMEPGKL